MKIKEIRELYYKILHGKADELLYDLNASLEYAGDEQLTDDDEIDVLNVDE